MIKQDFRPEKYLETICNSPYRTAMSKVHANSHTLEIQRWRYTKPKTNVTKQLRPVCHIKEDEVHLLIIANYMNQINSI